MGCLKTRQIDILLMKILITTLTVGLGGKEFTKLLADHSNQKLLNSTNIMVLLLHLQILTSGANE